MDSSSATVKHTLSCVCVLKRLIALIDGNEKQLWTRASISLIDGKGLIITIGRGYRCLASMV